MHYCTLCHERFEPCINDTMCDECCSLSHYEQCMLRALEVLAQHLDALGEILDKGRILP